MIKLLQHTEINTGKWSQLLETSPHASFFQTKACYDFYCSLTFMKGFVYAVEEDNQLVGLMCGYLIADGGKIKRFFSRRAIVPGGLLLHEKISDKALSSLLTFSQKQLAKQAIYIEIRNYKDYSDYKDNFYTEDFVYTPHLNIHLPTEDLDSAFNRLQATKKRQVRQTQKFGTTCFLSKDINDLADFYQILSELYRDKIKKPLFPYEFFATLIEHDFTKFFVVKKENRVIGGILCVADHKVLYEWFICGLEFKEKNIYPSVLATWTAIAYAAENKFQYFDFMGAGKPNEDYGVRTFKEQFGGTTVEYGRLKFVNKKFLFQMGSLWMKYKRKII